jgi:hypothetical protein
MLAFWRLEFGGGSYIFGKSVGLSLRKHFNGRYQGFLSRSFVAANTFSSNVRALQTARPIYRESATNSATNVP